MSNRQQPIHLAYFLFDKISKKEMFSCLSSCALFILNFFFINDRTHEQFTLIDYDQFYLHKLAPSRTFESDEQKIDFLRGLNL
jgi:hypothetical protein